MPSIYDIKPAFQNLLRPVVRGLVKLGWTPNAVTVIAFVMSMAAGVAIGGVRMAPDVSLDEWFRLAECGADAISVGIGDATRRHNDTSQQRRDKKLSVIQINSRKQCGNPFCVSDPSSWTNRRNQAQKTARPEIHSF